MTYSVVERDTTRGRERFPKILRIRYENVY